MKNDSSKFQLLKLSIKEFSYMLLCDVQYIIHNSIAFVDNNLWMSTRQYKFIADIK